jgi:hypothetical protein
MTTLQRVFTPVSDSPANFNTPRYFTVLGQSWTLEKFQF